MESEVEEFIPRNYQVALLEACLQENTIIFLPTGTGKTFIAVMALKRMGADLLGENHKVSIILVNTVALVEQHTKYIRRHTPFECSGFSGEMAVDFWKPEMWLEQFRKNQVLVMTCEILAGIVRGNIFDLKNVNLLIFDECHHAVNDHSMRQVMSNFENLLKPPRVIGLTATLLNGNCKPNRVMDEVRSLEVTFQAKVATADGLQNVVGFATNPIEIPIYYDAEEPHPVQVKCLKRIDSVLDTLSQIRILDPEATQRAKDPNLKLLEPNDGLKRVMNFVKDLKVHLEMLGIYGGKLTCLAYNILVERLKKSCDCMNLLGILNYFQTNICFIKASLDRAMETCANEKERFEKYSSTRVLALMGALQNFKKSSDEPLCGLIFVERRFTAKIIYYILDKLSKCHPEFSYIRTDFIVGNNNNPLVETRESLYLSKKNKQVLERFENKETNLLCTSQVLEEGIDIAKCTMVCRFDLPKDYRSYIQSKGRARHKKSHYYMLIQRDKKIEFNRRLVEFQEIEETLNDFLIGKNDDREAPSKEEIENMYNDSCCFPPYYANGTGSAYFNEVSAISLLSRYCMTLPADEYTVHSPEWYIKSVKNGAEQLYSVTIYMPFICPVEGPIEGVPMRNKKMAKRAAAYETCVRLHQCGELNDSLLPRERIVPEEDVSFLFTHQPKEKEPGAGMKKMRIHNLQIHDASSGNLRSDIDIYLHIINLNPQFQRENNLNTEIIYDMYTSDLCFGILTPKRLPPTFDFPIYVSNGTIKVSVQNNVRTIRLSEEELKKVFEFHYTIFNDVLEILPSFLIIDITENAESMILVPVKKAECLIDFNVIEECGRIKNKETTFTHEEKLALKVDNETYLQKIVIPAYRREITTYLVTKVCLEMRPTSNFPNESYKDFVQYYQEKHQEHIVNYEQPMLLVKGLSRKMNLYKPQGLEKKRKKEKLYDELEEYLVPEMLVKQEFPASLWIQARFLPTILSRLSFSLRVESLWRQISQECGFPLKENEMKPLELNLNLLNYNPLMDEKDSASQIRINYEKVGGVLALPTSLTSTTCNRDFKTKILEGKYPWTDLDEPKDIERTLEVSVMDIEAYENFINHGISGNERRDVYKSPVKSKYPALTYDKTYVEIPIKILTEKPNGIVELADLYESLTTAKANDIVNLERLETLGDSFLKYVVSLYIFLKFPQFDEGRATQLKSRIISNKNLFYVASKHNLGGIMKNRDLMPKNEWIPPGFCIPEEIRQKIDEKIISANCLFKCSFSKEERISGQVDETLLEPLLGEYILNGEDDGVYQNMDQFFKQQCLRDKCLADVVESVLGTYLQITGVSGCLKVLHWLGIIPPSEGLEEFLKQPPKNPLVKQNATLGDILYHMPYLGQIEGLIGYTFRNKAYILQAFTHASYSTNRLTHSYEKLEFLGDAILDFLVTCFIYESCGSLTPGELTDLRSALVNNNTFASYVVRLGFHKYLLMTNSKLQSHIDKFVEFTTMKDFVIDDEVLILLEEQEMNIAEYVDVPKVLGDIFEALAGAIFLDSGYCLNTVWKVFHKIMWREIDSFSRNVPKNMVRRLFECEGAYPQFSKAESVQNGRVMVKLNFHANGRPKFVHGFGSNKVLAKKAAAKIALRYL